VPRPVLRGSSFLDLSKHGRDLGSASMTVQTRCLFFNIGQAFPADDHVAVFVTAVSGALNDLVMIEQLITADREDKVPDWLRTPSSCTFSVSAPLNFTSSGRRSSTLASAPRSKRSWSPCRPRHGRSSLRWRT